MSPTEHALDSVLAEIAICHRILDDAGLPQHDGTGMTASVAGRLRLAGAPLLMGLLARRDASRLRQIAARCGTYADELAQDNPATADLDEQIEHEWDSWARAADILEEIAGDLDRVYRSRSVEQAIAAARDHRDQRSEATSIALAQTLCHLAETHARRPCRDLAEAVLALLGDASTAPVPG